MATDLLISDLSPATTPLTGADLLEVEQGTAPTNTSGKVTLQQISDFCANTDFTVKNASGNLLATDKESVVMNIAGANTLTILDDTGLILPVGTIRNIFQEGTGQTTIVAGAGVTILTAAPTLKTRNRYSAVTLAKRAANTWYAFGDFASS